MICRKEGFRNVDIIYIGGSWVWIDFDNRNTCTRFKQKEDFRQYFQVVQYVSKQFVVDDKAVWVEIIGMPLGAWSMQPYKKVAEKWGEVVFVDKTASGGICKERVCIRAGEDKELHGPIQVKLDGITHKVWIKEIENWAPKVSKQDENVEATSEERESEIGEEEEQYDSNSDGEDHR